MQYDLLNVESKWEGGGSGSIIDNDYLILMCSNSRYSTNY